jgi:hypothetical protein
MQTSITPDLFVRIAIGAYLLWWGILMPSWGALLLSAPSALYLGYRFLVPQKVDSVLLIATVSTEQEGRELFEVCKEDFEYVLVVNATELLQALVQDDEEEL